MISEVTAGTIEGKYQESAVREAASGCAQLPCLGAQAELKGREGGCRGAFTLGEAALSFQLINEK